MRPTVLFIKFKAVIPVKTGIQSRKTGFPRIPGATGIFDKYGAGSVKPGMTNTVKGFMTHY